MLNDTSIPWNEVVDYCVEQNQDLSRELYDSTDGQSTMKVTELKRHVVIFNPENSDYLIHFMVSGIGSGASCKISAVSREGIPDPIENKHIDYIIQTISTLLWLKVCD